MSFPRTSFATRKLERAGFVVTRSEYTPTLLRASRGRWVVDLYEQEPDRQGGPVVSVIKLHPQERNDGVYCDSIAGAIALATER